MIRGLSDLHGNEIAIVGMAGRFPKARNLSEFWRNLCSGTEAISFFTREELESSGMKVALIDDRNFIRAAAVLDEPDCFDAAFFGYSPREAELMDPQHRVLLEVAWEALEDAGYDPLTYEGPIGIFAGATINTYLLLNIAANPQLTDSLEDVQINIANGGDFLTTRISYKLNLRGPSHLVQSACSTSLVAVHLACQSLLNEESDIALAGGVSINEKLRRGYRYLEGGMASPDGHCRAFDARAAGTVFGSGAGIVVLKRFEDAVRDRDTIRAVIKGSAINNDGSLKVGYTAPSVEGQARVIAEAIANAGVEPRSITYIETHGTGTPLGDPIEIEALTKAFDSNEKGFCAIGSVKTNVGHLDAAAGITGLIKTALALEHKLLPSSLHFESPNPRIDFDNSPFYVNSELKEWKTDSTPRRAGVSAFGVGGTNAHVVLQEPPPMAASAESRPLQLLVCSAASPAALEKATANLAGFLANRPDTYLADLAYTLAVGRSPFSHRRALVSSEVLDSVSTLRQGDNERRVPDYCSSSGRQVAFVFPGQGSQHLGMGLELYRHERVFRNEIDACAATLAVDLGFDLRDILYPTPEKESEAAERLDCTDVTQPALFVIEYALARLWMSWGLRPSGMIGHSIGEYVAACLAEVISLKDALKLVSTRGRMMRSCAEGAMLSVSLPEKEAEHLLADGLSLAAVNGPFQCVISGPSNKIEELEKRLASLGIAGRRLQTSHAFHSQMMDSVVEPFVQLVAGIDLSSPGLPYISNVTGTWITGDEAKDPCYWGKHLRQTIRFGDGISELLKQDDAVLLEVGPGQSLSRILSRWTRGSGRVVVSSLPRKNESRSDLENMLAALGRVWCAGVDVGWAEFYQGQRRRRVPAPAYPFERSYYRIEPAANSETAASAGSVVSIKRSSIEEWIYIPSWSRTVIPATEAECKEAAGTWLIFADNLTRGARLSEIIRERGGQVARVIIGNGYHRIEDRLFSLDPTQEEQYRFLFDDLKTAGLFPNIIAHLWNLADRDSSYNGKSDFMAAPDLGFFSLLSLAKALDEQNHTDPVCILAVSSNSLSIVPDEPSDPSKAMLLGACKVIPQEYPGITCKCIDIRPARLAPDDDTMAKIMIAEAQQAPASRVVAYRGRQRWEQSYELLATAQKRATLPKQGVYLLIGGLEGIGFALARHLAAKRKARLIIVEERGFPDAKDWEEWVATHVAHDESSRKIINARMLASSGSGLMIMTADLCEGAELRSRIELGIERFGDLNGVVYAAGAAAGKSLRAIADSSRRECEWQFAAKVYGLVALEQALAGLRLDFCLLESSLSAVLGGIGGAAHAATNIFLDTFVQNHNKESAQPWISIDWDLWRLDDGTRQLADISEELSQLAITDLDGVEVFETITGLTGIDQVVVSTADLRSRIEQSINAGSLRRRREPAGDRQSFHPRPGLATPFVAPAGDLERAIAKIWQDALGIESIGTADNFFDLGGDSLLAVQVAAQLRKTLEVDLPVVSLYEGLTIKSLVQLMETRRAIETSAGESANRDVRMKRRRQYQEKQRSQKREAAG